MFITFQVPFIDLRPFVARPPPFVPRYGLGEIPTTDQFQDIIDRRMFIRSFGEHRLRGYVPDFGDLSDNERNKGNPPRSYRDTDAQWDSIESTWQDEYLYGSTRRGLRLEALERNHLATGKLVNPRAKIRAIRFSPFERKDGLWSPAVRIELGVLYWAAVPITGEELEQALVDFVRMKVRVPRYEREGAGKSAVITRSGTMVCKPLIEQREALAALIVDATTAQIASLVHHEMVIPGRPLLTAHAFHGELASLPPTHLPVPGLSPAGCEVAFLQMKSPNVGVWLFDLPHPNNRSPAACRRRVAVRNTTIAVMRYWSESQAVLALRRALIASEIALDRQENSPLCCYVKRAARFFDSENWHGARLATIRRVLDTYNSELPDNREAMQRALHNMTCRTANKLMEVGEHKPRIFVSYSHHDTSYLPHLHLAFSTPEFEDTGYFDDTYIKAGEEWQLLLKRRLEDASIAILLVSPNFLSSDYISRYELPAIRDRAKRQLLRVLPILLAGRIPTSGFLEPIQFLNSTPLSDVPEADVRKVFQQDLIERVRSLCSGKPLA